MSKSYFQLNAAESYKLFKPLFSSIRYTTVLPILDTVMIRSVDDHNMEFTGTDLENVITIKYKIDTVGGPLSFCLHGKQLKQVLLNGLNPIVGFTPVKERVKVTTGGFGMTCDTMHTDGFPKTPVIENAKTVELDVKEIYTHLLHALKFVSTDDLRPSMTGVCLIDWKKELYVVSTDAHCMYFKPVMKTPDALKGVNVIVPSRGVFLFLQAFKKGPVKINVTDQWIEFKNDSTSLICRLIDATYPNFGTVIPENELLFGMQRKQLQAFLKLAWPFVNLSTNQITFDVSMTDIKISGGDIDYDTSLEYAMPIYNINKEFAPFKFAVNLRFLHKLISISNDEYCKISHSGTPTRAMIIDDYTLLMPLMLNE